MPAGAGIPSGHTWVTVGLVPREMPAQPLQEATCTLAVVHGLRSAWIWMLSPTILRCGAKTAVTINTLIPLFLLSALRGGVVGAITSSGVRGHVSALYRLLAWFSNISPYQLGSRKPQLYYSFTATTQQPPSCLANHSL